LFHGPLSPDPVAKAPIPQPKRAIPWSCKLSLEHQSVSKLQWYPALYHFLAIHHYVTAQCGCSTC
jgi:hypothetical protein